MKRSFFFCIAALFVAFVTAAQAMGAPAVIDGATLSVCVEWLGDGFTQHADGIALATAGAASIPEYLKDKLGEISQNMKTMVGDLEGRIKEGEAAGKGVADLKEQVNKMATDNAKAIDVVKDEMAKHFQEVQDRQDEFETKLVGKAGGDGAHLDIAAPVVKAFKDFREAGNQRIGTSDKVRAEVDAKSLLYPTKTVTSLAASGGDLQVPVYEQNIIRPGEQAITLLDILPQATTESPLIYWVKEVLGSRTNNTAIQSLDFTGTDQGTALGLVDFVFDQLSAETRTFGNRGKVAQQMLDDVSQLRGYMENIMRYLVRIDLEDQVLNGNGTGKNISGLKDQATAFDATLDSDVGVTNQQNLDVLRLAILQCALTFFPATGTVLHPTDATGLELLKDGDQRYLFVSNPNAGQAIRPWGVPVVATTQQTQGDFTVGAMNMVEVVTRQGITVEASTENSDDFDKLLATIRAYGRFGLKVYQPGSIIDGDFTTAKA